MSETYLVEFPGTEFEPLRLERDARLAEELNAVNSPLLFGCRSGLCGTCLVEIELTAGAMPPPDEDEAEALEIYAPGNPQARLACQLRLTGGVHLRKIDPC